MKYFLNSRVENEDMEFIDFLFKNDFIDPILYQQAIEIQKAYRKQKPLNIAISWNFAETTQIIQCKKKL